MTIELTINCDNKLYIPQVLEDITLSSERAGAPAKLEFKVLKNDLMKLSEGGQVSFIADGVNVFLGYIFTLKYTESDEIQITAYDQLRYLKNKYTYVYKDKTVAQLIKMIANDFNLTVGDLTDTALPITRTEDNQTLFDIINNALDETLKVQKKLYVFYDDYGKLTLKSAEDMIYNVVMTENNFDSYTLSSSIDGETYNQIKIYNDNDKTGKRDVYVEKDSANIKKWGLLQYYEKLDKGENAVTKAQTLLKLYNMPIRKLEFSTVGGINGLRAGNSLIFNVNVGGRQLNNQLLISSMKHTYSLDEHNMSLTVVGGVIDGWV